MNRKSDGMSTGMAILCTIGVLLFIGWLIDLGTPKCIKSGCDNDAKEGSSYCYLHSSSSYRYTSKTTSYNKSTGKSGSSSYNTSSSSSSGKNSAASNSMKSYSSGSSSSKKSNSSANSYDDGYNAIYEDDDFDWDRYWSDDDYASGVDDAMEDEDW